MATEYQAEIDSLRKTFQQISAVTNPEQLKASIAQLTEESSAPDLWDDPEKAFGEILRETGSILREQLETEVEIGTLLARQQMEVKILRIIPLALLLGLKLLYPKLITFLTGTLPGILAFLVAGGLVAGALLLSQRFCEVDWE